MPICRWLFAATMDPCIDDTVMPKPAAIAAIVQQASQETSSALLYRHQHQACLCEELAYLQILHAFPVYQYCTQIQLMCTGMPISPVIAQRAAQAREAARESAREQKKLCKALYASTGMHKSMQITHNTNNSMHAASFLLAALSLQPYHHAKICSW